MKSNILEKNKFRTVFTQNIKENQDKLFALYIDSPFCIRQCSFCMHKGALTKINGENYTKYYKQYLPNLIDFYKPVFLERTPDSIYFGGGTSSVMTEEIMLDIFSRIPNFKDIKEKLFECNMILLNDEKIRILEKFNFTHISFGIQSFNENILKNNNRKNPNLSKIKEIVSLLQSKGFFINCDLMTFIDSGGESDIKDTINDLIIMAKYIKPNKITLYPRKESLIFDTQHGVEKVRCLRKQLLKNISKFNGYLLPQSDDPSFFVPQTKKEQYLYNYCFYKTINDCRNQNKYNSSAFPNCPSELQSVLGIGSYLNHHSYSYTDEIFVEEINQNFRDTVYDIQKKQKEELEDE